MYDGTSNDQCSTRACCCASVGLLVFIVFVTLLTGISYVQYYEVALVKGQFSGNGCYWLVLASLIHGTIFYLCRNEL